MKNLAFIFTFLFVSSALAKGGVYVGFKTAEFNSGNFVQNFEVKTGVSSYFLACLDEVEGKELLIETTEYLEISKEACHSEGLAPVSSSVKEQVYKTAGLLLRKKKFQGSEINTSSCFNAESSLACKSASFALLVGIDHYSSN